MEKRKESKKSKVLISAAAVALAASMLIGGGTYAYLQSETEDTVNKFNANQVVVDLDETTGSEYEIIPGTVQEKDPKVTVNTTVPAYVYVTVDDKTDGLVDYEIADGWTKLDGYDNVYYREVSASDEAQAFYVLADNQVSYAAALENSDMTENGQLKDGLELTFKAYAIQKDGFADAVAAYENTYVTVNSAEEFTAAAASVEPGQVILMDSDIVVDQPVSIAVPNVTIDGNGAVFYTSSQGNAINISASSVTVKDCNIIGGDGVSQKPFGILVTGENAVIDGCTFNGRSANMGHAIWLSGNSSNTVIKNCSIGRPINMEFTNGGATIENNYFEIGFGNNGITLSGSLRNITITGNKFNGLGYGIRFTGVKEDMQGIKITSNQYFALMDDVYYCDDESVQAVVDALIENGSIVVSENEKVTSFE